MSLEAESRRLSCMAIRDYDAPLPHDTKRRVTQDDKPKVMNMTAPVAKFRAGHVSCAIWQNELELQGRTVRTLKASVDRRCTDRNGAWKSSTSFSRNEIPQAVYCLLRAYVMMMERAEGDENGD